MVRVLILLAVVAIALEARAQTVYRWVMPDGTIRYSDQPQESGAVEGGPVEVAPVQTYSAPSLPLSPEVEPALQASVEERAARTFRGYDSFVMVEPAGDGAVRLNSGDLPVRVRIVPSLAEGHVIEIRVDGAVVRRGRRTAFVLSEVDRGLRVIEAAVRDETGAEVAVASPVAITLLRTSRCDRRREDFAGCAPAGPCRCAGSN